MLDGAGPQSASFCSGVLRMSAATHGGDGSSADGRVDRLLCLLEEAIEIVDGLGDWPDLGARLQEVYDTAQERRK